MKQSLRLAFMGTPEFSVPILQALIQAEHEITVIYCQPPRSAGRGKKVRFYPIHLMGREGGYVVQTPTTFNVEVEQQNFQNLNLDVAIVAAYGLILPKPILEAPKYGCLNVHASLLPRWRGAAPIQRAILAGDIETGVTIMKMDEGLDTGPILLQERVSISAEETGEDLYNKLSRIGARLLIKALSDVSLGLTSPTPQSEEEAVYADKLHKAEGRIDWNKNSVQIDRQVRALSPRPGVWFEYCGDRIKVLKCRPIQGNGVPGTVLGKLVIACGEGVLRIDTVQRSGKRALSSLEFLNGYDIPEGVVLP